jgi:hypothetical protein
MVRVSVRNAIESDDPHFTMQEEHRILYADGGVGYISVRFFIAKDKNGVTFRTYGVNQDITERKITEDALRARLEEIELFNKAAVGRELKMIDLENEIDGLLKELGRPARYGETPAAR